MMIELIASRMAEGDFTALFEISSELDDSLLFSLWASRALSLMDDEARKGLIPRMADGSQRSRVALQVFEAMGLTTQAQEIRKQLSQVASAFLAARLAEGDMPRLHEAIIEAEAEGLSEQVAEARAKLPEIVGHVLFPSSIVSSLSKPCPSHPVCKESLWCNDTLLP